MRVERKMRIRPLLTDACLPLLVLTVLVAAAQTPTLKTRTKEERDREYMATRRITLNVQVTDDAGKPVTDLDVKDFTLFDNHQPRKLAAFHAIDGEAMNDATEVVIVLDAVNSTTPALEAEKNGIFKYLAGSHGPLPYPTSFVLWSNGHLKATSATTDRNTIGRAFVSFTKNVHSNTCGSESGSTTSGPTTKVSESGGAANPDDHATALATCLKVHFKDSVSALDGIAQQQLVVGGRTILIWVGPGWPLPADADFQQFTTKARTTYFEEIVTLLHDLRAAQITLDALASDDAHDLRPESKLLESVVETATRVPSSPQSAQPRNLALPVLALQTGGRLMAPSNDVVADLQKLLDDADWYYALTFNPPPAQNGVESRSLEVKVNRPGLNVRTMTCYYTEP
jgi:VWFA-related protein